MSQLSRNQLKAIHTVISKKGLSDQKREIIQGASDGRTDSAKELTYSEAKELLIFLNDDNGFESSGVDRMVKKLVAMAYDLRWIGISSCAGGGAVKSKKDYSTLYDWVLKYGYLKKDLKQYTYSELPKLLSQFEQGPYAHYLKKSNQNY